MVKNTCKRELESILVLLFSRPRLSFYTMAKRTPKRTLLKKKTSGTVQAYPIQGVVLLTMGILIFAAIVSFELNQSLHWDTDAQPGENLVGFVGAHTAYYLFFGLGIAIWLLPFFFLWWGVRNFTPRPVRKRKLAFGMALVALLCAAGLLEMLAIKEVLQAEESLFKQQLPAGFGGFAGHWIAERLLYPSMGSFGSLVLLGMGFMIGMTLAMTDHSAQLLENVRDRARIFWIGSLAFLVARKAGFAERRKERAEKARLKAEEAAALAAETEQFTASDAEGPRPSLLDQPIASTASARKTVTQKPSAPEPRKEATTPIKETLKPKFDPKSIKIVKGEKPEKAVASIPEQRGDHKFPPIQLLSESTTSNVTGEEDHAGTMDALVRTLEEFGVKVIPGEIYTGPVITRYEVTPAPGVRVEKIVNLDKNIALGLKAESVRILAPVPGKGTVGIEVPNRLSQAVCMRDIVESKAWAEANAEIPIVLGKDVTGIPMVADLTKMPHVLIAGSTGSGKTVCINAIIASLLYHSSPEDLRFIMVDPKVVEMQVYNALPHMLIPVVTEPKKVPGALKWLIAEMERRYQIFATENVRNIAGFNAKLAKTKEERDKAAALDAEMTAEERAAVSRIEVPRDDDAFEIPRKKLPYIVCVIDELADLMMVAPADIETGIARLAQLARAAGIHLILATQRPSVNVITGVIKANLPSRISFKVASKVDSRTILDGGGAEALIGRGDMLFIPPGTATLMRAQGAFVSDDEINGIVEYLKENNEPPNFAQEVQQQINSSVEEGGGVGGLTGGDEDDEEAKLLAQAIDVLRSTKRASTSMLQRRLRIGYNRAARLMDELEERGIVGPENGSSPREILVDLDTV
ncbi:MAG: DNA translocase FtsK [Opitutia bacterium UBA7350]|nr:MAG: DNA translocase FtsK [Opitutae bacterium UBA7350]